MLRTWLLHVSSILTQSKNTSRHFNNLSLNKTAYKHNVTEVFTRVKAIRAKSEKNYTFIFCVSCFENECIFNRWRFWSKTWYNVDSMTTGACLNSVFDHINTMIYFCFLCCFIVCYYKLFWFRKRGRIKLILNSCWIFHQTHF